MTFRSLTLLGSTGSIGTQALEVVRHLSGRLRIAALAAGGSRLDLFRRQVAEFAPAYIHLYDKRHVEALRGTLAEGATCFTGAEGLARIAAEAASDLVLVATVGWSGLEPALAAIGAGRHVALATKEVLVCGGDLVMRAAREKGVHILPVDSEHNAIHQCLHAREPREIRRLILTCSGGPFRNATCEQIDRATREDTLRHPTWDMGSKITVDSATLMNKGLEVIEAHHLFGVPYDKIDVVIHPESIVHSMVEFVDGSIVAQLGSTDMRLPIQYALTWPERVESLAQPLDLARLGSLNFSSPDHARFPCLGMAYAAGRAGGTMPCVLNAANEVAVQMHLDGTITCGRIADVVRSVTARHEKVDNPSLEELRAADKWARAAAREFRAAEPPATSVPSASPPR